MLSGELASRTRKLEREQAQRLEKLRAREEKERLVAQRQAERECAREEEIRQRRLAQEAAREAVRKLCSLLSPANARLESAFCVSRSRLAQPCTAGCRAVPVISVRHLLIINSLLAYAGAPAP